MTSSCPEQRVGASGRAANPVAWSGDESRRGRAGTRARQAPSSRFRAASAGDRHELARLVPSGRSLLIVLGLVAGTLAAVWGAHASTVFAVDRVEVLGAPPAVERQVDAGHRRRCRSEPARRRRASRRGHRARAADRRRRVRRPLVPAHARHQGPGREAGRRRAPAGRGLARHRDGEGDPRDRARLAGALPPPVAAQGRRVFALAARSRRASRRPPARSPPCRKRGSRDA